MTRLFFVGGVSLAAVLAAADAGAVCRGRPTDSGGYAGYVYGADVSSYATDRVRVHFAASGAHAPNLASTRADLVPDSVAFAADTAEEALSTYASWGYKPVPADTACPANGGDGKVDIYLVSFSLGGLAAGADGSTIAECVGATCSSFVLVESTFASKSYASPQEGFRTVVTHELFHAIQNVYKTDIEPFWGEGTAQWAMKTIHPELQDFERQLPAFFSDSGRSIDAPPGGVSAGFLYGAEVWPLFLAARHGKDLVRTIIEGEAGGDPVLDVTDTVLVAAGSSLADEYPLFAAWNAATGPLAGPGGYVDAAKYPGVKLGELADGVSGISSGLSYFAYRGTLATPTRITLDTEAARNGGVLVPIVDGAARLDQAAKLPADASGDVLVVVSGITSKKTDAPFTITFASPAASASSSDGGCAAAPVPVRDAMGIVAPFVALVAARRRRRR